MNSRSDELAHCCWRAVSLFKDGLDLVSDYLLNHYSNHKIDIFNFLSCT